MRRSGRNFLRAILAVLLLAVVFAAFWFGLVPQRFSPFASLSLADPPSWFVDPRLAAIEVVFKLERGSPDGFAFDAEGAMVIACPGSETEPGDVQVWSLKGELLRRIDVGASRY